MSARRTYRENVALPRKVSLEGLRAVEHFLSERVQPEREPFPSYHKVSVVLSMRTGEINAHSLEQALDLWRDDGCATIVSIALYVKSNLLVPELQALVHWRPGSDVAANVEVTGVDEIQVRGLASALRKRLPGLVDVATTTSSSVSHAREERGQEHLRSEVEVVASTVRPVVDYPAPSPAVGGRGIRRLWVIASQNPLISTIVGGVIATLVAAALLALLAGAL